MTTIGQAFEVAYQRFKDTRKAQEDFKALKAGVSGAVGPGWVGQCGRGGWGQGGWGSGARVGGAVGPGWVGQWGRGGWGWVSLVLVCCSILVLNITSVTLQNRSAVSANFSFIPISKCAVIGRKWFQKCATFGI